MSSDVVTYSERSMNCQGLPPTRTAAASLSHGTPHLPAPTPGSPDAWRRHPRTSGGKGPQQPALVN